MDFALIKMRQWMAGKGRRTGHHDDGDFYERWQGDRTKIADVITADEVDLLEELIAPWQIDYEYLGPALGTEHVYRPAHKGRAMSSEPPDWLIAQRRALRLAALAEREAIHAQALALDQSVRDRTRYRAPVAEASFRARRTKSYAVIIHCECGHKGRAIVPPGQTHPLRLRCSQCDALQML